MQASYIHMQHTATQCNTVQHTATHCNTLQRIATHYNTLQRIATHWYPRHHAATHCNTLQHTATHCNTLQQLTYIQASYVRVRHPTRKCVHARKRDIHKYMYMCIYAHLAYLHTHTHGYLGRYIQCGCRWVWMWVCAWVCAWALV